MEITIVAAVSKNGVIGKGGKLPWSLPTDLQHFKKLTEDGIVIMGRKTYESIGSKPLPKRYNIVVSSSMSRINLHKNLSVVPTLDQALWLAQEDYSEAFIIGGEGIYKEAFPMATKMIITHVDTIVRGGDAFLPFINTKIHWMEDKKLPGDVSTKDDYDFSIVTYKRLVEHVKAGIDWASIPITSTFSIGPTTYADDKGAGTLVGAGVTGYAGSFSVGSSTAVFTIPDGDAILTLPGDETIIKTESEE